MPKMRFTVVVVRRVDGTTYFSNHDGGWSTDPADAELFNRRAAKSTARHYRCEAVEHWGTRDERVLYNFR